MATRSFPRSPEHLPNLDRRRFLASAALASTALPVVKPTEITLVETVQPLLPPLEIPTLKLSSVTASHLAEIAGRNLLRQESGLPLLSIPKELRRIKTAEASAQFAKFSESLRKRVQEKMLAQTRRRIGDPNWKPARMMAGMAFEYEVSREVRKLWERVR